MANDARAILKHVNHHFFSRFETLFPIQEKAIPLVLQRKNVVIVSSTASGKTEAVIAPLVELLIRDNWFPLSIVYISPTRALVNDMYERLFDQIKDLNITVSMKTGDRNTFKINKPSDILITTPESLDSLICRHPKVFGNLEAIIIDEIHFLDNNYRGDQMRILLQRLRKIKGFFNVYLLSATVSSPRELGLRYTSDPYLVFGSKKRDIIYTLAQSFQEVFEYIKREGIGKILVFCNSRQKTEKAGIIWGQLVGKRNVVVHHGSLGKKLREEAEAFMKQSSVGVCVSTMTLEIGIDIGNIEAVILSEIPWTISSFLQRIGRANRKSDKIRVFAIYNNEKERKLLEEMFLLASNGIIENKKYIPDYSVVVQQVFSSLYAKPGGLTLEYFFDIFKGFCEKDILIKILLHLQKNGWIVCKNDRWYGTSKFLDWEKRGRIHSNIPDQKEFKVKNLYTKELIGKINIYGSQSDPFLLGGRVWKIVSQKDDTLYVKHLKNIGESPIFSFPVMEGYFAPFLPEDLRRLKRYSFES